MKIDGLNKITDMTSYSNASDATWNAIDDAAFFASRSAILYSIIDATQFMTSIAISEFLKEL